MFSLQIWQGVVYVLNFCSLFSFGFSRRLISSNRIAPDIKPIPNRIRHEWTPTGAYTCTADPET